MDRDDASTSRIAGAAAFQHPDFIGYIIFWDKQTTRRDGVENRGCHRRGLDRGPLPGARRLFGIHAVWYFWRQNDAGFSRSHIADLKHALRQLLDLPRLGQGELEPVLLLPRGQ